MAHKENEVKLSVVTIDGAQFYKISHVDTLRPFFMSIVSDSDHWMFIGSNGGLTAGRKNAEYALFPYYTDDKIVESAEITGNKSIFQVSQNGTTVTWEPFSIRYAAAFNTDRNLYKNAYGNTIIFEEINHDLGLGFQYQWGFSTEFGFIKNSKLVNHSGETLKINMLDGLQNIVPYGVGSDIQNKASNLTNAYKRSELDTASGLGIFALSAIIVDKAEPSEALKANAVFSTGLKNPRYLLSSLQLNKFREHKEIAQETDIKGEKGAYFVQETFDLLPASEKTWQLVANVNLSHTAIVRLIESIKHDKHLEARIREDIDRGTENLVQLCAAADGLQYSADSRRDSRHYSNVLFNIMRGGIFDDNYQIERGDLLTYLEKANRAVFTKHQNALQQLPEKFPLQALNTFLEQVKNADLIRLATEYLPLKFSRRHGDPSRPWNRFSINVRNELDGSKILDYEGNWRDIFQNWEALAHAYPAFMEGMIYKFLNASTFDGYNPYRITKDGFDWETIEPDDPWSYIGYWGDHQIIYLLKFLEFSADHFPDLLPGLLDKTYFVYANVPYKIKPYRDILENPKDTIDFDFGLDENIRERRAELGADGALLQDAGGSILHVNFIEKILATVLAKLSNFIPEGGIWMNTQRPEWNDANNALVGNGVSMVTLCYLSRFMLFLKKLLAQTELKSVPVSAELAEFYRQIVNVLERSQAPSNGKIDDRERKNILDRLGEAASAFRWKIYKRAFEGAKQDITLDNLRQFVDLAQASIAHTIRANERTDHLYHGYNLMTAGADTVSIEHLSEMLEGQVAALSSGSLTAAQSLQLLDALKASALYREDQHSYLLYPNKNLPGFLQKNTISEAQLTKFGILKKLSGKDHSAILEQDALGKYHFNGNFKNAGDLEAALNADKQFDPELKEALLRLFESVFNHKSFTGRSGTFFGYEGLGSIYWHMVSKLRLAVLETVLDAIETRASAAEIKGLAEHYYEISEGIGVHKSPEVYGAFPTDPYSHTPLGKGAQQPGMTGQVKEDILCRLGELGVFVRAGKLHFQPKLLRKNEFLKTPKTITFFDVKNNRQEMTLPEGALFFTYCQVPVIYVLAAQEGLELQYAGKRANRSESLMLTGKDTKTILNRTGDIVRITVSVNPDRFLL